MSACNGVSRKNNTTDIIIEILEKLIVTDNTCSLDGDYLLYIGDKPERFRRNTRASVVGVLGETGARAIVDIAAVDVESPLLLAL